MSLGLRFGVTIVVRLLLAGAALLLLFSGAFAEVEISIDRRDHTVDGSTASALVRSMHSNPIHGDSGNAYASIHPNFVLSVSTRQKGGLCRADVDVRLSFTLTLPKAASPSAMSARTRSAWSRFVSFATAHEAHHQASYTGCAKSFVARVKRQSAGQCLTLQTDIRRQFNQMKRDCEATQRAYDRAQSRVLPGLSLFAMARAQRR